MTATVRGTVRGMAGRANPAFASGVVAVSLVAFVYALGFATVRQQTYVHVLAGVLWTGIDVFMGVVLGPVIGSLDEEARADVFQKFTPKMAFLMPMLALVTVGVGVDLAIELGKFPNAAPWLALFTAATLLPALACIGWQFDAFRDRRWLAAFGLALAVSVAGLVTTLGSFETTSPLVVAVLAVVAILSVQGFGLLLPGEVKVYREMMSADPDPAVMSRVGMRNARLAGVQGFFQLVVVGLMVLLRWGV